MKNRVFAVIVVAQFLGTSLWFAGNAVLPFLELSYHWSDSVLGYMTSATQLGFILGTLLFAVYGVADKFSPSRVFFWSAIVASVFNLCSLIDMSSVPLMITSRFIVGFFLAGVYPVGMKIASDWKAEGLGRWLGALVGALVLGTAFPQVLKLIPQFVEPTTLLLTISVFSVIGGVLVLLLVPDGPYRKTGSSFSFVALKMIFRVPSFRSSAIGYFGHMWELYAFWAFVPWMLKIFSNRNGAFLNEPLLAFMVIGAGALGCFFGGLISSRVGSATVARFALVCSGICCIILPMFWYRFPLGFVPVMIFWGVMAAADSPQFSALVSRYAPDEFRGSAITLVICIGFAISIVSIQLLNALHLIVPEQYLSWLLAPGPIIGVLAFNNIFSLNKQ